MEWISWQITIIGSCWSSRLAVVNFYGYGTKMMDFTVAAASQTSGGKHHCSTEIKRAHTIFNWKSTCDIWKKYSYCQFEKDLRRWKEILLLSIKEYSCYLQKYLHVTPVKETPLIQIFMHAWINVHIQGGDKRKKNEYNLALITLACFAVVVDPMNPDCMLSVLKIRQLMAETIKY